MLCNIFLVWLYLKNNWYDMIWSHHPFLIETVKYDGDLATAICTDTLLIVCFTERNMFSLAVFDNLPEVMKLSGKTGMETDRENVVFHLISSSGWRRVAPVPSDVFSWELPWQWASTSGRWFASETVRHVRTASSPRLILSEWQPVRSVRFQRSGITGWNE